MDPAKALGLFDRFKEHVIDKIKIRIEESNDSSDIFGTLDEAQRNLIAYRLDMEAELNLDIYKMKPFMWLKAWINQVDHSAKRVKELRSKCKMFKWCIIGRSRFRKRMQLEVLNMVKVMEGDLLKHRSWSLQEIPAVIYIDAHDLHPVPAQQHVFSTAVSLLLDPKVTGVGLFGLPGVGKTTILKNINNSRLMSDEFDMIIWLIVSTENGSINRSNSELQQSLCVRLGIDETRVDPCWSILSKLKGKKVLLLLDDVCEPLDMLDLIGLPLNKVVSSLKVVLTARRRSTCVLMVDQELKVDMLNKKDSHSMFASLLGNTSFLGSGMITEMIHEIVDNCGGFPLMISVAANYFKDEGDSDSWKRALSELRKWPKQGDMMKEAYSLLKTFFDSLDKTTQRCFLYASLYPANTEILTDLLVRCWGAEELLIDEKMDENMVDPADIDYYGHEMLDFLLNIGLIQGDELRYRVNIHPLIRCAYLHFMESNVDYQALVISGCNEVPELQNWNRNHWISITETNVERLPDQLDSRALSTLFLQKTRLFQEFSRVFINSMDRLVVLDASDSNIMSVPTHNLGSLKVLVLRNCKNIRILPCEVGHLKNLEVLDIRGTGILSIPTDICNLTCLKSLLVSFRASPDTNVLDKADCFGKALKEVCLLEDIFVEVEESHYEVLYASLLKFLDPSRLQSLQFCCPSSRSVTELIHGGGFEWRIFLHSEYMLQLCMTNIHKSKRERMMVYVRWHFDSQQSQMMSFKPWCYMFEGPVSSGTIREVLRKDAALDVCKDDTIEHLWEMDADLLNQIRGCTFRQCDKMVTVLQDGAVLNNIEALHLVSLRFLKSVYEGEVRGLRRLKTLVISDCGYLQCVCPHGLLLQLPSLEHLEVRSCPGLTRIFNHHQTAASPVLPKLAKLILVDLPRLKVIIERHDSWPALEYMTVVDCPRLVVLPFKTHSAPNLKLIQTKKVYWEALENADDIKEKFYSRCQFA